MAKRTPLKAIRAKCIDCTNGQNVEIRECPITECPLYEYRMGHRPPKTILNDTDDNLSTENELDE